MVSLLLSDPDSIEAELLRLHGEAEVRLCYLTKPDWTTVKGNPFAGKVLKRAMIRGRVNRDYGQAVNEVLVADGQPAHFKPGKRKWGERIEGTPIVKHGPKTYAEVFVESVLWSHYVHNATDTIVPLDLVESFLKPAKPRPLGGPMVRDFELSNIKTFELFLNCAAHFCNGPPGLSRPQGGE